MAGSPSPAGPAAPTSLALTTANGNVLVDWPTVVDATAYRVYWAETPAIDPTGKPFVQVAAPPYQVTGVGGDLYCVVTSVGTGGEGLPSVEETLAVAPGSPEQYFPPWSAARPLTTIPFNYDFGQTSAQNGAALETVIQSLSPGDELRIGSGTYTIDSLLDISLVGTAGNPIWIVAAPGATPVITRSNASQNTVNMGQGGACRYVVMRGIEITGGSIGLRLHDCQNVWIDQCHVHDMNDNAIAANSVPTSFLYFTRNQVHSTGGTGEGFYIGGNFASPIANNVVIALNHVYDCGGSQGDGIEVKQGSWGCWIAENTVHDTNYPSILVYGTGGMPVNLIERNVCWNAGDNVMQVQGEAIVRNNVLIDGLNAFYSGDHQGTVTDLIVVNNTFVNTGRAALLNDWNGKPGMTFANNACYSLNSNAILFSGGSGGVTVSGNVAFGSVSGTGASGYLAGTGLGDFLSVSWNGVAHDATPSIASVLLGSGAPAHEVFDDLAGRIRTGGVEAGAVDAP